MQFRPLPQGFGVEVEGFDVLGGRAPEDVAALQRAFDAHHLLIFRGCGRIDPDRQVEISRWFGPVPEDNAGDGKAWTVLRNDEASGRERLPFHSDITYCEHPLDGISLHPQALPEVETTTTFVSNAVGWAALPAQTQARLAGRKARHYYAESLMMEYDWPVFEHWHQIRLDHPRTGQPLLFVTEHHADRIEGLDEAEGAALLRELFAVLYAPERQYVHVWREGDLLVWDNLAIQHARTRKAEPAQGPRILQRVSIGAHSFMEQLETARRRQAETAAG